MQQPQRLSARQKKGMAKQNRNRPFNSLDVSVKEFPGRQRRPRRRGQGGGQGQNSIPRNNPRGQGFQLTGGRGIQMPDGLRESEAVHPFANDEVVDDDVLGSTTSRVDQFAINPGQSSSFPWLSALAARYEKYRFNKLEFYYKRQVSEFATQGTTGKVVLSFDYDASDPAPSSKTQQLSTKPHVDGMPSENMVLSVDCRRAFENGPKFIRPGMLPGASDIKLYDCGNLNLGVYSNQAATTVGELHVRYSGVFETPVLESTTTSPTNRSFAQFRSTAANTLASTIAEVTPVATEDFNGIGAVNAAGVVTLQAGNYKVNASSIFSAGTSMTGTTIEILKNGVAVPGGTASLSLAGAAVVILSTANASVFISSDGNDTVALQVTEVGTGALTDLSVLEIQAV